MAETFDWKKNPALAFCEIRYWLAYREGRVVGRIAGIINHAFIKKWKNKYMSFGWVDFEEDEQIIKALLHQVESWAREKGMTAIHGPLGFTNYDSAGMLIRGFDQLGTYATIYNYPYYPVFLEKAGYRKEVDWIEYRLKVPEVIPEKLMAMASIVERRNKLRVLRTAKSKDILPYAHDLFSLLNSTYADLFGVVALNEEQIQYYTRKFLKFIRPDFVTLVFDENGVLAAAGIAMPSLSQAMQKAKGSLFPFGLFYVLKALRKNDVADLCMVAVRKDLQGKGINAILMREFNASYIRNNIQFAESNPELEENAKVQSIWEYYEAVQHKQRRCFIKILD